MTRTPLIAGAVFLLAGSPSYGADVPPNDGKPLSEVISGLESQGYTPVDVEYDDGHWEVQAYRENSLHEIDVDPHSGDIIAPEKSR